MINTVNHHRELLEKVRRLENELKLASDAAKYWRSRYVEANTRANANKNRNW
jgi:hypothetical protein